MDEPEYGIINDFAWNFTNFILQAEVVYMRKKMRFIFLILVVLLIAVCGDTGNNAKTSDDQNKLAKCLTEKGWVMYGTTNCSACIAQKKAFGDGWKYISYIECDPYEKNSNPELCLKRNINKTPTWILEVDGKEVKRLESYQILEDLVVHAGC